MKRVGAASGIVVLDAERLVPVPGVGEIVENHLSDLAALLVRQTRLHPRRFGGDMLDDFVCRSTRLDGGTFHDEIDRAQRKILDIQTVGDSRVVLEDYTSLKGQPRDRLGQKQVALLARQGIAGIAFGHVHKRSNPEGRGFGDSLSWKKCNIILPLRTADVIRVKWSIPKW